MATVRLISAWLFPTSSSLCRAMSLICVSALFDYRITSNRYLEDGNFAAALERCHDAEQEERVREAEADSHFDKGQFEHAARLYAQTSRRCVWNFG